MRCFDVRYGEDKDFKNIETIAATPIEAVRKVFEGKTVEKISSREYNRLKHNMGTYEKEIKGIKDPLSFEKDTVEELKHIQLVRTFRYQDRKCFGYIKDNMPTYNHYKVVV